MNDPLQRVGDAWQEVIQQKANTDGAMADKRWADALKSAGRLRFAASDLEDAIYELTHQNP